MKKQIERLSPHQNGKVLAVLMAVSSIFLFLPFILIVGLATPKGMGPGIGMLIAMPIFYFIFTYLWVALTCWIYNHMFKHVGGIEYEVTAE